jgi:hypothetical protein
MSAIINGFETSRVVQFKRSNLTIGQKMRIATKLIDHPGNTAMKIIFLALALLFPLAAPPAAAHHAQPTPMLDEEIVQSRTLEERQPAADVNLNAYSKHDARIALYIQVATLAVGVLILLLSPKSCDSYDFNYINS